MNRKIRVAPYGCGKMSIPTMKYVYDHGAEVVCAFSQTDRVVGKDIGALKVNASVRFMHLHQYVK